MNTGIAIHRQGTTGHPIVFLHYFGGAAASWQWVIPELASHYRCFALNLPGFGNTNPLKNPNIDKYTDWILEAITSLNVPPCIVVGHSMSGKLALSVAASQTEKIDKVVLIAPSPPTQEPMHDDERQRMLKHPDITEAEKTVDGAIKAKISDEQRTLGIETQLAVDHATWRWWLLEGMNHSISDRVAQIKHPVHLLTSKDDPVIPFKDLYMETTALIPHLKVNVTESVGHLIPLEAPQWLTTQISFIAGGE